MHRFPQFWVQVGLGGPDLNETTGKTMAAVFDDALVSVGEPSVPNGGIGMGRFGSSLVVSVGTGETDGNLGSSLVVVGG